MGRSVSRPQQATKLQDHVRELLMRLFASFITLVIASFVVYAYYEPILEFLRSPLGAPLYYSNPAGSFAFVMKICFMGALIITIPVLAYNLIMFVRPAFEKAVSLRRVISTALFSAFLAISGAAFAFVVILPNSLRFFEGFQVSGLNALISADSYLGFVTNIIITFIIMFQLPLLITFIDHIKPIKPSKLLKWEKWVFLGSSSIALLAPFTFDMITMVLIALPIIALYNLSIALVLVQHSIREYRTSSAIHSTVVKPVLSNDILVDDNLVLSLADDLINLDKPKPIATSPVIVAKKPAVMDFNSHIKSTPVQPAAWVIARRERHAATLAAQVKVFSDISRAPRINRASI